jgi:beta-N-acetylhexosaminidase
VPLELKIAEMIMMGFTGTTMADIDAIDDALRRGRTGNLVLFDRNVVSPDQLAALNTGLAGIAQTTPLIAVDQEGGFVARLRPDKGFPETVTALYLGNRDVGLTRQYATSMATTLRDAGFNLNLAPVLDVNVDPNSPAIGYYERSFSADPEVVAEHGLAFIRAHHEQGVLCTLKHFAGHGSASADSHLGFVDVSTTWSEAELIPFRRVIEAGEADAIMTAHIFNSQLDDTYPGTLSRKTITGLLREELGFDGVVITDDMQMGAIRQYFGYEEAIRLAILAGADMIAVANVLVFDPELPFKTFDAIMAAVESGEVTEERIDQSYGRIRRLKNRLA